MKRVALFVSLLLVLFLVASAPAASPSPQPIKLKIASYGGPTYIFRVAMERAMDVITKRSNGLITWDYYPGGALFDNLPKAFTGVAKGLADIGITYMGETSPELMGPFFYLETPPFSMDPPKVVQHWRDPGSFFDLSKPYWEKNGLYNLTMLKVEWNPFPFRVPINKLEDWKGKLVRTTGGFALPVKALGAEPVVMPLADVYQALQRGTIDGAMSSLSNYVNSKLWEVAKYEIECKFFSGLLDVIINLKTYRSLDPRFRKIIEDAFRELEPWALAKRQAEYNNEKRLCISHGTTFITIPDSELVRWRKLAIKPFWDAVQKRFPNEDLSKLKAMIDSLS
jgi:TRAP-type C4-dicarboxylate transport system substrate-binding protein